MNLLICFLVVLAIGWIVELGSLYLSVKSIEKDNGIKRSKRWFLVTVIGGILVNIGWYGSIVTGILWIIQRIS